MNEEEAYLAVEPPLALVDRESEPSITNDDGAIQNPFKLKGCYVRLQRILQIELIDFK